MLNNWVGLVFQAPLGLGETERGWLNELAGLPFLPRTRLEGVALPTHVLRCADDLEAARAAGLDLRCLDPGSAGSVRAAALLENASPAAHAALDAAGVPAVTLKDAHAVMGRVVRELKLHAFDHLADVHPDVLRLAMERPQTSRVLELAFSAWAAAQRGREEETKKRSDHLLRRLTWMGAKWGPAREAWEGVFRPSRSAREANKAILATFDLAVTGWRAQQLAQAWASPPENGLAPVPRLSRPRL